MPGQPDLVDGDVTHALFACLKCGAVAGGQNVVVLKPPRQDWRTPAPVYAALDAEYHFNLDAAASASNAKTPLYQDVDYDSLKHNWYGDDLAARGAALGLTVDSTAAEDVSAFDNCPYERGMVGGFLEKALEQAAHGVRSVHLIPMSSSVEWFNYLVVPYAEWHTFLGRIAFEDPLATETSERLSPKQDNLLVIYNPNSTVIGHTAVRHAKTGLYVWRR